MTDIRSVLQSEVERLRALVAEYAPTIEQLRRAEHALRVLTGERAARSYNRASAFNAPGKAPDMIMDWIRPGYVVSAQNVADGLNISPSRAVVSLNRLANMGRLERVSRGRFRLKEVA
jgi:hypothetical protein